MLLVVALVKICIHSDAMSTLSDAIYPSERKPLLSTSLDCEQELSKDAAFVSRLKLLIDEFGSARAFARACGVSESAIRKWHGGTSEPTREKLVAMAEAANVSIEWLASGRGSMRPSKLTYSTQIPLPSGVSEHIPTGLPQNSPSGIPQSHPSELPQPLNQITDSLRRQLATLATQENLTLEQIEMIQKLAEALRSLESLGK